jgi:hypothetical protein
MKSQVVLFAGRPKKFETGTVPLTVYELNDKPKQPPKVSLILLFNNLTGAK